MTPSIGRIVHYTLSEQDAQAINRRREDFDAFQRSHAHPHEPGQPGATGHQAHVGNPVVAGLTFPAMIVRVFTSSANLQVFLDGNDTYWATSRSEGEGASHWAWPPRV
ncbi:hypothetical protein ACIBKY_51995 [Nonomuraea sp. NPDC050394]|uniref:hypothetical protein n=1 Tax=Nonomuraea sp. NPDC050394 TaxID=3364363 RepID=UPI0037B3110D